jgi:glycosyltransferase involved in cell wall biosynthesis
MLCFHNLLGTWRRRVTLFLALTEFCRRKYIQAGFPSEQILVKPNFVPIDLGPGRGDCDYVLYVGRLSAEKGVPLLLSAWRNAAIPGGRLVFVGDGPCAPALREAAAAHTSISYLGPRPLQETYQLIGGARALAFPSLMYEGMPRVIIEAFSRGTPVIAFRSGSMTEMVADGQTGWLLEAGDCDSLARALSRVFQEDSGLHYMRVAARTAFERNYSAERNYDLLLGAYNRAFAMHHAA